MYLLSIQIFIDRIDIFYKFKNYKLLWLEITNTFEPTHFARIIVDAIYMQIDPHLLK